MIKRYIPDIAGVFLVALMAVMLAGKPVMNRNALQTSKSPIKAPLTETQEEAKAIERQEANQAVSERNIFAASETYAESVGQPLPDDPYALIAVLHGKERRAVFRDYTGVVSTFPVGKKLMDGFVITRIDALTVELKKKDVRKELRLFNAGGGQPPPAVDKGGVAPVNLYMLIGIFGGDKKQAVFRDYKGSIVILGVGSKLIDGAVITSIDQLSVKLKKGKEASELRVFDVHNSEQSIRKKS